MEGRENFDTECVRRWSLVFNTTVSGANPTTVAKPVVLSTSRFSCSRETHTLRKTESLPTRSWAGWTFKAALKVRKEVLTVVLMKSQNFCNVTLWRLVNRYWRFEGGYGLLIQGPAVRQFELGLTFSRLMTYIYIYIYIYMSYRTANLQMLHFIYLFNKYTYWIF